MYKCYTIQNDPGVLHLLPFGRGYLNTRLPLVKKSRAPQAPELRSDWESWQGRCGNLRGVIFLYVGFVIVFERFFMPRLVQSLSETNHRNTRNPMKNNSKTLLDLWESTEPRKSGKHCEKPAIFLIFCHSDEETCTLGCRW